MKNIVSDADPAAGACAAPSPATLALPAPAPWRASFSTRHISTSRREQAKLRRLYLDTLTLDLITLMLALSDGEIGQARRTAHRIKGAAMLTGDTAMVSAMDMLQQAWARNPHTAASL